MGAVVLERGGEGGWQLVWWSGRHGGAVNGEEYNAGSGEWRRRAHEQIWLGASGQADTRVDSVGTLG
jgi:hypothetical protein